jgi:tetratricopeptide (TPR) repeat protein
VAFGTASSTTRFGTLPTMLHASLLGTLEFTLNDQPLEPPSARGLELLVFLASSPMKRSTAEITATFGTVDPSELQWCAEHLEFSDDGLRFLGSSDVNAYRSLEGDLKALARLRGEFAPGLTSENPRFRTWLERQRFDVRRVFLVALLHNGAGLIESGRTKEGTKNLEFVEKEAVTLAVPFAAELALDIASVRWRLNQPEETVRVIENALPDLEAAPASEARVNLGAALLRVGRARDAVRILETLPETGSSRGWGLVHRANALRFTDDLERAVQDAEAAYALAARDEDGYLAVAALNVKGETLLEQAIQDAREPKEAVIAFGKALGISEVLGEDASALTLAGLAHAHAVWGNQQKALEQAEKAFKRARTAKDASATIRALLALYATTRIGSFARNAVQEARAAHHKPYELLAVLSVLEKDKQPEPIQTALELAHLVGSSRLLRRAEEFGSETLNKE